MSGSKQSSKKRENLDTLEEQLIYVDEEFSKNEVLKEQLKTKLENNAEDIMNQFHLYRIKRINNTYENTLQMGDGKCNFIAHGENVTIEDLAKKTSRYTTQSYSEALEWLCSSSHGKSSPFAPSGLGSHLAEKLVFQLGTFLLRSVY